jgi:hypothetical protein
MARRVTANSTAPKINSSRSDSRYSAATKARMPTTMNTRRMNTASLIWEADEVVAMVLVPLRWRAPRQRPLGRGGSH